MTPKPDTHRYATVPRLCPGGTVVCIASGPSLTTEDVEYVRGKADRVIVVNNGYQIAPWADCLCASDLRWWHWHKGAQSFAGLKYATSKQVGKLAKQRGWTGIEILRNTGAKGLDLDPSGVMHGLNTGYRAINVAVHFGAARILLLGYDMQQGQKQEEHWHKDHPGLSRSPYPTFVKYFTYLVEPLANLGIEVINCTPRSALTQWPQRPLREVLLPRAEAVAS
jgi:hypothetical protein